jgi:DNA polymerase-3 subunit alpha
MDSLAISDHGNMFGAVEFYTRALAAGIKPIIGYEAYIAPGDRRHKEARGIDEASYHLLLLAQNLTGYKNLLKLASSAYLEGFYYRPRIDKELLREYNDGLICTTACLAGEVASTIMREDSARARPIIEEYLSIFGDQRFYLEVQDHGLSEQRVVNEALIDLGRQIGVGLVATNDVHYIHQEDARAHEILVCVNTGKKLSDEKRLSFGSDKFYLRSGGEMTALFEACPEAIANTVEIARHCNVELSFGEKHAPRYHGPDEKKPEEYLRELVYEGARNRYREITDTIRERIDYELGVICSKGFASYFLIVWDFVDYARKNGIPCGARGSAGGTVVGYCLGICTEDPLTYGLFFERFMDPERNEMPDIDVDICQTNRPRVIDYVRKKYGHVAQIITFNTLAARAAIRDVGRVLDIPLARVDMIAKKVPAGPKVTLQSALAGEPELKKLYDDDEQVKELIDVSMKLEGLARNASVHAAGVVVAERPLENYLPLSKSGDDVITQFEGNIVDKVGLLKIDLLGLRTLTTLQRAVDLVKEQLGVEVDLDKIPLDEAKVFELFARGETKGIFQFESDGMRDLLMRLKPDELGNLIAANALYRPGPMMMIDDYVQRKHGQSWGAPHPIVEEILRETFGIMVYQEQVMQMLNRLGNIPLGRAYRLIKAISKKNEDTIEAEHVSFVKGCAVNGLSTQKAEELFELIRRFGGYGFNKSHSTRYAVVAYQTAYMKTCYPPQFMAALLTFEMENTDKVVEYIQEAKRMGIAVLPPDVNASGADFTVIHDAKRDDHVIRFGLAAVKGVGTKAVEAIIKIRNDTGPFTSLYDFCCRLDQRQVNRGVIEALIRCGAFDSTGARRKAMADALERTLQAADTLQRDAQMGQMNMFDALASESPATNPLESLPDDEWPEPLLLSYEKQTLGFYITSHPLTQYAELIDRYASTHTEAIRNLEENAEVIIGGLIEKIRTVNVKGRNGGEMRRMGIVGLEDLHGRIELVVFPDDYDANRELLKVDAMIFVRGTIDRRREEPSVRVAQIYPMDCGAELLTSNVIVKLSTIGLETTAIDHLLAICRKHSGQSLLTFVVRTSEGHQVTVRAADQFRVKPTRQFVSEIDALLGAGHLMLMPTVPGSTNGNSNGIGNGYRRANNLTRRQSSAATNSSV